MSGLRVPIRVDSMLDANAATLAEDVLDGLTRPFKELPPKHFYDARGSELFARICELPEYYPTRAERAILEARAEEIVTSTGAEELVEIGSGYATKTRVLLDAMRDAGRLGRYVPFDVSESTLREAGERLADEYPGLDIHGIAGDFERHLDAVPAPEARRVVAFLGGTIGNFAPGSRRRFLRSLAALLGEGDHLLLGTDLVKDPAVLEAAYDDAAGLTAEFNRNVLRVVNRELGADFDPGRFEHVAFYDREHEWVEMRLRAIERMTVSIPAVDLTVEFAAREELRTEISAKFTASRLEHELRAAGLELVALLTDEDDRFGLSLARPAVSDETA
ncbi:MAG TPA: L-histidine N(alpha)-methyltransferase [Solirubrobacteraceae bacterium]|nr:L-histidine N(alpha)-methyltransferase [Solirubrobacteraceae bacterium]